MNFCHARTFVLCSILLASSNALGQARFIIEGDGAPTPQAGHLPIPLDTETEFTLSIINEGPANVAGSSLTLFNFSGITGTATDGLSFQAWDWVFPEADNPDFWFAAGLPDPANATFFEEVLPFPPDSVIEVAIFSLIADSDEVGVGESLALRLGSGEFNQIVSDGNFEFIDVVEESLHQSFVVVPEPTTMGLLAVVFSYFGGATWKVELIVSFRLGASRCSGP